MDLLRERWLAAREDIKTWYPQLESDPYLSPKTTQAQSDLLSRFLRAEEGNVDKAFQRLQRTTVFRRIYNCLEFHRQGSARKIITSSGAELYFSQLPHTADKEGNPLMVGRLLMCNENATQAHKHLRAAMLVCERMACQVMSGTTGGCYILDLRPVDFVGKVSATGGGGVSGMSTQMGGKEEEGREEVENEEGIPEGWGDEMDLSIARRHAKLAAGLPTLREAMRLLTAHYPELLGRVFFFESPWWFWGVVNVFKLWLPHRTRGKLAFVSAGAKGHKDLLQFIADDQLPIEFGGTGPSLDQDGWLERAICFYDEAAILPAE